MAYEKRVCVLKQIKKGFSADGSALSGAVYCERLGRDLTVTVRLAGLAPLREGRYALVLSVGGKTFCSDLGKGESLRVADAPSLSDGFSALLCFVRQEAEPVAFGNCGREPADYKPLLSVLADRGETKKGAPMPVPIPRTPQELPPTGPNQPSIPFIPMPDFPEKEEPKDGARFREGAAAYDDEAIAEADYFLREDGGNESAKSKGERSGRKKKGGGNSLEDDEAVHPFAIPKGSLTYYKEVRYDLEKAFKKNPKDTRLLGVFPQSEWVKAKDSLLGIVYENGIPRYLCVAAEKTGDPPEELKENCVFVPSSPFSDEAGFYIVFQDADTGAYVRPSSS